MGEATGSKKVVLLMDSFDEPSRELYTSLKEAGVKVTAVTIEDDGFLPDDMISIYSYFYDNYKDAKNVKGAPLYFNEVIVPDYWEISGTNSQSKIMDLHRERGKIIYAEPSSKRLVKTVDWFNEDKTVRISEHFNKYGALYAKTIYNQKGKKISKSYFDACGKEIIVENFVTKDIILNEAGGERIFRGRTEFAAFFIEAAGLLDASFIINSLSTSFLACESLPAASAEIRKDGILFWQEGKRSDIPLNMTIILNGRSKRFSKIYVKDEAAFEKLASLGANRNVLKRGRIISG